MESLAMMSLVGLLPAASGKIKTIYITISLVFPVCLQVHFGSHS